MPVSHENIYLAGISIAIDSKALYIRLIQQQPKTDRILPRDLYYATRYYQQQLK